MGLDVHVNRIINKCDICGIQDDEALYYAGKWFLIDYNNSIVELEKHVENCKRYTGLEAIKRIKKIRSIIDPYQYSLIMEQIVKPGAIFYAWW